MFSTTLDRALQIAMIFLPALIAATLATLARRSIRLTIRTLSVAGLIALLAGLAFYDIESHLGSQLAVGPVVSRVHEYLAAGLLLATERWLFIAALAFALWDAASRRLRWWSLGLAATLIAGVAFLAAFGGLPVSDLFGGLFVFALNGYGQHVHTAGQERLFHVVVEILLALAYLPALFYASRFGGPVIEEALAPTVSDR